MRLAILSDIHGNVTALRAVLRSIERDGVDGVYCLGDMFAPYPGSLEIWDLLKARDVQCVLGNNEAALLAQHAGTHDYAADEVRFRPFLAIAEEVRPIIHELRQIPAARTVAAGDAPRVHLCHYSPDEVFRGLHSTFEFDLDDYVLQCREPIIFTGHLHRFEAHDLHGKTVYTVGSAGMPLKGSHQLEYALVELDGRGCRISYRLIPYDVDAEVDYLLCHGFMRDYGPIAWLAFDEILTQRDRLVPFFKDFVPARAEGPKDWYALAEEFLRSIDRWEAVRNRIADC